LVFYLAGIKGTGLSHLASYLKERGDIVRGCDVKEDFFTSSLLEGIEIDPLDAPLPLSTEVLIYSSAYEKRNIRAINEAKEKRIPAYTYPDYLAYLSREMMSAGVSGTHGKTTVTAMASHLVRAMKLKGGTIYGSFLSGENKAVALGDEFLILEACEYQNHFLSYSLDVLVITNIEFDHPDFFADLDAVKAAFRERVVRMNRGGVVIYHSSLKRFIENLKSERSDLAYIRYGEGKYFSVVRSHLGICLSGLDIPFCVKDKNPLILDDYIASALVVAALMLKQEGKEVSEESLLLPLRSIMPHISTFPGVTARGEVVLESGNITYIDDYAHHPSEIKVCLSNLRLRYPSSRLVVLFMPHTASRTEALLKEFVSALSAADAVFVESTYASARGDIQSEDPAKVLAKELEKKLLRCFYLRLSTVQYTPSSEEAVLSAAAFLQEGDVCITMGAGDNRSLITRINETRMCL